MKRFFKKNWRKFVLIFLTLYLIFSTFYLIFAIALYKGVETKMRIVGCITLIDILALIIALLVKFKKKVLAKGFVIISIIALLYSTGITFVGHEVNGVYNVLNEVTSEQPQEYSSSLVVRSESTANSIDDIRNDKVAIFNDEEYYEAYTLPNKIIEENQINSNNVAPYDSMEQLLLDLLNGKINFALLPSNYATQDFENEGLENISERTKIIYTKKEKMDQVEEKKEEKKVTEPFTMLIMGVDTVGDGIGSNGGGDALILVTFNPNTTNATILSIPRDTYMKSCSGSSKLKVTDAARYGQKCVQTAIENYFGITIDYYAKINFNGVVQLVNAVGGVEVDVPYAFCEQNSKRQWGKNTVFVNVGKQTLNGEQALAFARHRKITSYMRSYCGAKYVQNGNYWNDFTRGQHQQLVIKALLAKFKDIDYNQAKEILNTISKNFSTNMSNDNILSFYNLGKNILKKSSSSTEAFSMQKLYLSGKDANIYSTATKTRLYYFVPYAESKQAVVNAMKQNLGLQAVKPVKKFSYSIQEKYTEYVIGKGVGSTTDVELMPNLVGKSLSEARNVASQYDLNLVINYITAKSGIVGNITAQDVPVGRDLDLVKNRSVTVTVIESIEAPEPVVPTEPTTPDEGSDSGADTGDTGTTTTTPTPTTPETENTQ